MCGIAGFLIIEEHGTVKPDLEKVTVAMSHRGPDDAGIGLIPTRNAEYSGEFGHRRLAIIDLFPAGHQPMQDPDTGNWLVFNGEIYNFQDIRRELEGQGHREGTGSSEGILDRIAVHAVWKRFLDGKGVWVRPWALYVVQQWCARHLQSNIIHCHFPYFVIDT